MIARRRITIAAQIVHSYLPGDANVHPRLILGFLGPRESVSKQHWFSRFAKLTVQHRHTQSHSICSNRPHYVMHAMRSEKEKRPNLDGGKKNLASEKDKFNKQ